MGIFGQCFPSIRKVFRREALMFVITMAGESRRFTEAGYAVPKYRLPLHGDCVFAHAVRSFARYFAGEDFLFAFRAAKDVESFVRAECRKLKIVHPHFVA